MMQAFHWDCPRVDGREGAWWSYVREKVPDLARAGFTMLWLPPVHKAGNVGGASMGYDPYDYYDLGEFDQKGGVETWFGSRDELLRLIETAHGHGLQLVADIVINHNNGADAQEASPVDGQLRWTRFQPKSGRFPRNFECFHPSVYESWDENTFGQMPDLVHRNPYVFDQILQLARWLVEEIGFDGFRYDFVKGYGSWMITAIQEFRYQRGGSRFKPYGVGENWSSARTIKNWFREVNAWTDNPVDAFDFPLRDMLKELCDRYGFSLRGFTTWETFSRHEAENAVTFVENHDLRQDSSRIHHDKLLAYGYVLTHEGYPCVFWKDYYNEGLAGAGTPHGIDALVWAHETFAGGGTDVLWVDDDLYVMQRRGSGDKPGLVFVLNNRGDRWNGSWVTTQWHDVAFTPVGWWSGSDLAPPEDQWASSDGRAQFWAPPRGYAVYAPRV
ncbi:MAG TPA: alpha-amylase family glycosyl hydrolase [Longimicrobium sp.]